MGYWLKITSWNCNGLRSIINGGYESFITDENNDIICLQEVKMHEDLLTSTLFYPKNTCWNCALKRGYSGVATVTKENIGIVSIKKGIDDCQLDTEGRVLTIECNAFILVNVYAPHSHRKLIRLKAKERFIRKFNGFIRALRYIGKPIIIAGDLNAAHQDIDIYHDKNNKKNAGFLPQERQWISDLISMGFVDAFRLIHPNKEQYSWWGLINNLRDRNIGWRIDYILVDLSLVNKIVDCYYSKEVEGSDHCPVTLEVDI